MDITLFLILFLQRKAISHFSANLFFPMFGFGLLAHFPFCTRPHDSQDVDSQGNEWLLSSTAKLRIWTLRIWVLQGPGFRSARQVLCGDASRLFLDRFSQQLWGGQSSVTRSGKPGPKNPKSSATKTTIWHCSILLDPSQRKGGCGFMNEPGAPKLLKKNRKFLPGARPLIIFKATQKVLSKPENTFIRVFSGACHYFPGFCSRRNFSFFSRNFGARGSESL